jgi:hypothetical protein
MRNPYLVLLVCVPTFCTIYFSTCGPGFVKRIFLSWLALVVEFAFSTALLAVLLFVALQNKPLHEGDSIYFLLELMFYALAFLTVARMFWYPRR